MQIIQVAPLTTTDATVTTAWTRAVTASTGFTISGRVEGRKSDRTAMYTCRFQAQFRRASSGALALVGSLVDPLEDSAGAPAVSIAASSNNAVLNVAGIAAETWNWKVQDMILTRF